MALGGTGAGHRVLVFAQLKGMLDLVEADVLRPAGVSFLRLDGRLMVSLSVCCSCAPLHLQCKMMQGALGLCLGALPALSPPYLRTVCFCPAYMQQAANTY